MCCCCSAKACCVCTLLVLVIVLIGFVFGFGIFAHGFHKIQDSLHITDPASRPFLGFPAPPPLKL
ncbi:uncharacterized protein LOC144709413 [Wolffia australiana]